MGEMIGYARCSTQGQKLDSQIKKLEDKGCTKIFYEKISAVEKSGESILKRPELKKCLASLNKGDIFVATAIDRVTRQVPELFKFTSKLEEAGADLKFIQYDIDTTTPMGKLFFYFVAIFAEMERNFTIERTQAGLAAAKARGKFGGRPAKLTFREKEMLFDLYKNHNYTRTELCVKFKLHFVTFHRYLKQIEDFQSASLVQNDKGVIIQPLPQCEVNDLIVTFKQNSLF
jgi:DNA invertase Pin-like site-specific DNA recombinase